MWTGSSQVLAMKAAKQLPARLISVLTAQKSQPSLPLSSAAASHGASGVQAPSMQ